jgi:pimeloyl-ACP methyl ester carboxylesterase
MSRNVSLSTETHTLPDGRTLAYTTSGASDGIPVVAHHGTPGSRLFAAVLSDAAAEEGVKLIVPDRPGWGRSSPPPAEWLREHWARDLTDLLRTKSIDRAAVLGFSGGGPFALAAAASDWTTRLGTVSTVVPPADNGLVKLTKIPFAMRILFRFSTVIASMRGPETVVRQYTDRSVSKQVAQAIAEDFHEAFRQGTKAVAREHRAFATGSVDGSGLPVPVKAWHGTRDENTPLAPVRALVDDSDGALVTSTTDHLGTLLDQQRSVFRWLSSNKATS